MAFLRRVITWNAHLPRLSWKKHEDGMHISLVCLGKNMKINVGLAYAHMSVYPCS